MELIIIPIVVLLSVYLGYKMGKGEPLEITPIKMRKAVRSEADEAELEKKLKNEFKRR
jgi:hypothetical protein